MVLTVTFTSLILSCLLYILPQYTFSHFFWFIRNNSPCIFSFRILIYSEFSANLLYIFLFSLKIKFSLSEYDNFWKSIANWILDNFLMFCFNENFHSLIPCVLQNQETHKILQLYFEILTWKRNYKERISSYLWTEDLLLSA